MFNRQAEVLLLIRFAEERTHSPGRFLNSRRRYAQLLPFLSDIAWASALLWETIETDVTVHQENARRETEPLLWPALVTKKQYRGNLAGVMVWITS